MDKQKLVNLIAGVLLLAEIIGAIVLTAIDKTIPVQLWSVATLLLGYLVGANQAGILGRLKK